MDDDENKQQNLPMRTVNKPRHIRNCSTLKASIHDDYALDLSTFQEPETYKEAM